MTPETGNTGQPPVEISTGELMALRLRAQYLSPAASGGKVTDVARSLCGVNAQLAPAMALALRARIPGLSPAALEEAITSGQLIRTWAMRGTLHLLPPDDLLWIMPLLNRTSIDMYRRRRQELGLDKNTIAVGMRVLQEAVTEGRPLTRADIYARLAENGVEIDRGSQALYHLLYYAAFSMILCRGPDDENGDQTYVPFPRGRREPSSARMLARLVCRYLQGYGPASTQDFTSWSGLPAATGRIAFDQALRLGAPIREVTVGDRRLWILESQYKLRTEVPGPGVRLLPAFDTLTLGYADRQDVVPPAYRTEVYHGGQTRPVLLADNRVAGVWNYRRKGRNIEVIVRSFEPLSGTIREAVEEEANDVRLFLGFGQRPIDVR